VAAVLTNAFNLFARWRHITGPSLLHCDRR